MFDEGIYGFSKAFEILQVKRLTAKLLCYFSMILLQCKKLKYGTRWFKKYLNTVHTENKTALSSSLSILRGFLGVSWGKAVAVSFRWKLFLRFLFFILLELELWQLWWEVITIALKFDLFTLLSKSSLTQNSNFIFKLDFFFLVEIKLVQELCYVH